MIIPYYGSVDSGCKLECECQEWSVCTFFFYLLYVSISDSMYDTGKKGDVVSIWRCMLGIFRALHSRAILIFKCMIIKPIYLDQGRQFVCSCEKSEVIRTRHCSDDLRIIYTVF